MKLNLDKKIVFYDGVCGLCQRSVAFLVKLDSKKELLFAPLNGKTYNDFFSEKSELDSVVFYYHGRTFVKSDAIIEVARSLGGIKKILVIFKIIPLFIRNSLYDVIARYRKNVSCIILPKDSRFLE